MKIEYKDGLLFTEIVIGFNGQKKVINNVVIDTGASHTLISQDEVDDIGIKVTVEDDIIASFGIGGKEHAFTKTIQSIAIGDYTLRNVSLDFTSFKYHNINGLLGLDILLNGKFHIDLDKLELLSLQ
ncbi:retropepsin-like aspartic protease [Paenibacillus dendritiformis]|uniref:retropepsin-like aspartic protease n=1 Tax=Paenibacillus dendritiformis TaxID=130049 RepID=UPI0010596B86|nr:retropepsin-like aspartic protease [Paenibacillus dendritiformis]TDL57192.1 aspartyl protease [Paenibacillus dendritiformis]